MIQIQVLQKMISLVIFTFQMYISLIHYDMMFQFLIIYHLKSNVVKQLLLLVHLVQENQLVYNYYNDSMMFIQVQYLLMRNKSMNTI
jgi:hypothetical protein